LNVHSEGRAPWYHRRRIDGLEVPVLSAVAIYGSDNPLSGQDGVEQARNDRVLVVYGMLASHLASFGVLYFWVMGAVLLFTGNGGQILDMELGDTERLLYLAYPAVVLISLAAWGFYALKRDLVALGLASLPVVLAVAYFIYLVSFR
jgi:hypothetical protein